MGIPIQVVVDCRDPATLAPFWAAALDYVVQPPPEGFEDWPSFLTSIGVPPEQHDSASAIVDPEGAGPRVFFQRVPEDKTVKNRVHLDVNVGGGPATPEDERRARVAAAAERLTALGATVRTPWGELGHWAVLQDPEGNEFCLQ